MATHSSVLAWRIPGTVEPGGLPVYGVTQSRTPLKHLSSSSRGLFKDHTTRWHHQPKAVWLVSAEKGGK